ncbi:MAG: hypothetical protein GEV08_01890 [Acidimicrobiia bacterium]|nr:hypothetical protein [Acidimicrobiia bacterium]
MRLFLDAHVSGRRVARALREAGHDVRAADEERALDGMSDENLLALAAAEGRVLVTFNVADFPVIVRRWAEAGQPHAGCAIVVGIDHSEFGTIIRVVERALEGRPDPRSWRDYTCFVARRA